MMLLIFQGRLATWSTPLRLPFISSISNGHVMSQPCAEKCEHTLRWGSAPVRRPWVSLQDEAKDGFSLLFYCPPGPVVWRRILFPSLVVLERCGLLSFLCGLFPELQSRGTGSDERAHICICFRHWLNHWNAIIHQVTFLKKYFVSWTNNNVPVHRKQCGCAQIWDL